MHPLEELRGDIAGSAFFPADPGSGTASLVQLGTALAIIDRFIADHPGLVDRTCTCVRCFERFDGSNRPVSRWGAPENICPTCAKDIDICGLIDAAPTISCERCRYYEHCEHENWLREEIDAMALKPDPACSLYEPKEQG